MTESEQKRFADQVTERVFTLTQMSERIRGVEVQMANYNSQMESEKRTRYEANRTMNDRLRDVEKANWKSMGALAVLMVSVSFAAPLILKWVSK